jgi:hypothetical protein
MKKLFFGLMLATTMVATAFAETGFKATIKCDDKAEAGWIPQHETFQYKGRTYVLAIKGVLQAAEKSGWSEEDGGCHSLRVVSFE